MTPIEIAPYPDLRVIVFKTVLPGPLGQLPSSADLLRGLRTEADVPVSRSEELRLALRDLLRHEGYKPTGRGKPASEYLVKAAESGRLGSINLAVDACNVVSLHSGFPISVVDLDRTTPPLSIKPGTADARYIFNAAGQEIDVSGLLCLHDADGPCANPVKDAQRTKTGSTTSNTLTILWGLEGYRSALEEAYTWYQSLLEDHGARTERIH